ncbi:MAG: arylsulfatase [Verrucomicrobia bacterium]|jgi:arylsulfatase A-like enzyme|nr:arylsulfatase [Verrucomicrobiota bacterium]
MRHVAILTALLLAPLATLNAADKPVGKPNILYFLADDMGYADAGFNGGKDIKTPNLDQIARDGAILKAFYVQPVCSPTRSALMTGRYPSRTGVYSVVRPHAPWGLKLEEQTLAQVLRSASYETAICGKWHLGEFEPAYRPTQRGFDHQYGLWFGAIDYFTHCREGVLDWHRNDQPCKDEGYATHLIAKEACRIIRDKNPDKPLFLYLPFNAVHAPHQVPEKYCAPYPNLKGVRRTYAGMLSAMDEAIGQVLAALDEKKIRHNTLIIFSSDNGGPSPGKVTSNGPLRAGKGTIYEGGIRVCACVNWPGHIPAGKTIDEPLHAVDWYPTLAKLAGATPQQTLPLDGFDIWPVLTAGAKTPHDALILCGTQRGQAAIRMGDWKLLVGAGGNAKGTKAKESDQLYNLAEDIGETRNLAADKPDKLKELRTKYDEMMKTAVPSGEVSGGLKE